MNFVDDYIKENLSIPDYNLTGSLNQQFFFQEGGFARFFPVLPGGYQPIQSPSVNPAPPEPGQHALWNSVANNGMQFGDMMSRRRIQKEQLALQKQEFDYKQKEDILDNQYKQSQIDLEKQRLAQQASQFQDEKFYKDLTIMSTMQDKAAQIEVPAYAVKDYTSSPVFGKWATAQQQYDAKNPDSVTAAVQAYSALVGDPQVQGWMAEAAQNKRSLTAMKDFANSSPFAAKLLADPEVTNAFDWQAKLSSGQKPDKPLYIDPVKAAEKAKQYSDEQAATNAAKLAETKALTAKYNQDAQESQGDAVLRKEQAAKLKLADDLLQSELNSVPEGPDKLDKQLEIYNKFESKYGKGTAATQPQNVYSYVSYLEAHNYTHEEAVQEALRVEAAKNSSNINYNKFGETNGGENITPFSEAIYKTVGGQFGIFGTPTSAVQGQLQDILKTKNFFVNGPNMSVKWNSIPNAGNMDILPTQIKLNPDGKTATIAAVVTTLDEDTAKKIDESAVPDKDAGKYKVSAVITVDLRDIGVNPIPINTPGTQTKVPGANTTFKSDSSSGEFSQRALDTVAQLPVPVKLADGDHHANPDNFDIPLGANLKNNQEAYDYIQSEDTGLAWAIQNGYEVHYETNNKAQSEQASQGSKYFHPAMFTVYSDKATAPHLHVQRYQDRTIKVAGTYFFVNYNVNTKKYDISDTKGGKPVSTMDPNIYLANLQDGSFQPD